MAISQCIAVFGLGSMGAGMARSLIHAGHNVHGFDVRANAVEQLIADGGARYGRSGRTERGANGIGAVWRRRSRSTHETWRLRHRVRDHGSRLR
jgi:3-hydroxyacyl-CoA dehydrogenase